MGYIVDSKGRVMDDVDPEEDFHLLLWQGLGFSPGKVDYAYAASAYSRSVGGGVKMEAGLKQEKIDAIRSVILKYGKDPTNLSDPEKVKRISAIINVLMKDLDPNAPIRTEIMQAVNKSLTSRDELLGQYISDAVDNQLKTREAAVGINSIFTNPLFVPKGE